MSPLYFLFLIFETPEQKTFTLKSLRFLVLIFILITILVIINIAKHT